MNNDASLGINFLSVSKLQLWARLSSLFASRGISTQNSKPGFLREVLRASTGHQPCQLRDQNTREYPYPVQPTSQTVPQFCHYELFQTIVSVTDDSSKFLSKKRNIFRHRYCESQALSCFTANFVWVERHARSRTLRAGRTEAANAKKKNQYSV